MDGRARIHTHRPVLTNRITQFHTQTKTNTHKPQDWLHNAFLSLNATLATTDAARRWLRQMGRAALKVRLGCSVAGLDV